MARRKKSEIEEEVAEQKVAEQKVVDQEEEEQEEEQEEEEQEEQEEEQEEEEEEEEVSLLVLDSSSPTWDFEENNKFVGKFDRIVIPEKGDHAGKTIGYTFKEKGTGKFYTIPATDAINKNLFVKVVREEIPDNDTGEISHKLRRATEKDKEFLEVHELPNNIAFTWQGKTLGKGGKTYNNFRIEIVE